MIRSLLRGHWWLIVPALLLGGYWLLPISGTVTIDPTGQVGQEPWPRMSIEPTDPQPGDRVTVTVTDNRPWVHVLLTVDGVPAEILEWGEDPAFSTWTWHWEITLSENSSVDDSLLDFYVNCRFGCRSRGRLALGSAAATALPPSIPVRQTKLCTSLVDPQREWHGSRGWVVDVTYARLADDDTDRFWRVDELATRVADARRKGLRVLVRADYDQGQTLPGADDYLGLTEYLAFVERLAQDDWLAGIYAYIIGSGPQRRCRCITDAGRVDYTGVVCAAL